MSIQDKIGVVYEPLQLPSPSLIPSITPVEIVPSKVVVAVKTAQLSDTIITSKGNKDNKVGKVSQIAIKRKKDKKKFEAAVGNMFQRAAASGNIDLLKLMLKQFGGLVNQVDNVGNTPLLVAAYCGHAEICDILISAGAKWDVTNKKGRNVLHHAAASGKTDVVQLFVSNKSLRESRDQKCYTPLLLAFFYGHVDVCEILIKAEAGLKSTALGEKNVLHMTAAQGKLEKISSFAANEKLLKSKNDDGNTPLRLAVQARQLAACKRLLKLGADAIYKSNSNEQNVLRLAAAQDKITDSELFLMPNNEKNRENPLDNGGLQTSKPKIHSHKDGLTSLLLAASTGKLESCKTLLKDKASIDALDEKGYNVLHHAVMSGNPDVVRLFADNEKLLNSKSTNGETPLLLAACKGDRLICEVLIKFGANIEATTNENYNVLHLAVISQNIDLVRYFSLDKRFLESQGKNGYTPLLLAVKEANKEMYQLLLGLGAKAEATTPEGHNALHLAIIERVGDCDPLLDVLLTNKRLLEMKDKDGNTPLLLACDCRRLREMAAPRYRDQGLRYSFSDNAAEYLNSNILKKLVSAGADKNATNKNHKTALEMVKEIGIRDEEAFRILADTSTCVRSFLNFLGCNCGKKGLKIYFA